MNRAIRWLTDKFQSHPRETVTLTIASPVSPPQSKVWGRGNCCFCGKRVALFLGICATCFADVIEEKAEL